MSCSHLSPAQFRCLFTGYAVGTLITTLGMITWITPNDGIEPPMAATATAFGLLIEAVTGVAHGCLHQSNYEPIE